jgi:hypothetical protein
MGTTGKSKISLSCQQLNYDSSAVQLVTYCLHSLHYTIPLLCTSEFRREILHINQYLGFGDPNAVLALVARFLTRSNGICIAKMQS